MKVRIKEPLDSIIFTFLFDRHFSRAALCARRKSSGFSSDYLLDAEVSVNLFLFLCAKEEEYGRITREKTGIGTERFVSMW